MFKAIDKWLPGYLRGRLFEERPPGGLTHLMLCFADHFEPFGRGASRKEALAVSAAWLQHYPKLVAGCRDADGRHPRHTFFYPQEEYDAECVELIGELTASGFGEVEVHLHHRDDTPAGLQSKLESFRDRLRSRHGLLCHSADGRVRYGFIHGNWALCNSGPGGRWCGVNEELSVLRRTGCFADFTFPSAPSPTQPRMVNAIYYARDSAGRPRGHDRGVPVGASGPGAAPADGLMLIQGPLALNWRRRKWGLLPRLENAAVAAGDPPRPDRIRLWARQRIHVAGRPEWVFVKIHTHGAVRDNMAVVLGDAMRRAHDHLQSRYNDGEKWQLHYVTCREMYNIIRAAEAGETGTPGRFRDFEIGRPPRASSAS